MTSPFTPNRSDAIRAGLIANVASSRPRRRFAWAAGLLAVGAIAGAGVSAAAFAATDQSPSAGQDAYEVGTGIVVEHPSGPPTPALTDPVIAPPGVVPGTPVITVVGDPVSLTITTPTQLALTDRPDAATHVRVTITCLTAGKIVWGTDPSGNNPSSSCTVSDAGTPSGTAWMDLPLDTSTDTLFVTPGPGAEASVTLQYVNYVPTLFGVNARGETYGDAISDRGQPDLILVEVTSADGTQIQGYVRTSELNASSPEHAGQPSNPDEALKWQAERDEKYPNGWDIPVYESDGVTVMGSFHVGT